MIAEYVYLDLNSEIKRYLEYIEKQYLQELKINQTDKEKQNQWIPNAVTGNELIILPVLNYEVDEIDLLNLVRKEPHSDALLRVYLRTNPTGKAYRDEQEYFKNEIVPLFEKKENVAKISMAINSFVSQLNRRFNGEYHEGQLRLTKMALADLLYMTKQTNELKTKMQDISDITNYNGLLDKSKRIECSKLPDSLFIGDKVSSEILEKQNKNKTVAVDFKTAVLIK
jgi:hypothetical protein